MILYLFFFKYLKFFFLKFFKINMDCFVFKLILCKLYVGIYLLLSLYFLLVFDVCCRYFFFDLLMFINLRIGLLLFFI